MGLDCFWKTSEKDEDSLSLEFEPELRLCGGLFSGHGSGSFRGKVYEDFINRVTGYSLYYSLSNEEVKEVASSLTHFVSRLESEDKAERRAAFLKAKRYLHYHEEEEVVDQVKDLQRMFIKYSKAGASLYPWY